LPRESGNEAIGIGNSDSIHFETGKEVLETAFSLMSLESLESELLGLGHGLVGLLVRGKLAHHEVLKCCSSLKFLESEVLDGGECVLGLLGHLVDVDGVHFRLI